MTAEISNRVSLPFDLFDRESASALKKALTFTPRHFDPNEPAPAPVHFYKVDRERRMVEVPLSFGWDLVEREGVEYTATRAFGQGVTVEWLPDLRHGQAPAGQAEFAAALRATLLQQGTALGVAATGSGKTVVLLHVIGTLKRTALVIVPSRNLAVQWRGEAVKMLGIKEDDIGLLIGDKVEWKDKKIVVAVIHNLIQKEWEPEFYRYFGIVCYDECHRVTCRYFTPTLGMFPARYQVAVTATPNRKDGMQSLFYAHLAATQAERITATSKALPCDVEFAVWRTVYPVKWQTKQQQRAYVLSKVAADTKRNLWLADMLIERGYNDNRHCLAVSDRKEHLREMQAILIEKGIPEEDTGLFIGGVPQKKLEQIKKETRIILATYNMIKEGVDIPRLDFGMDLTPRSDAVQMIGRIRRPHKGKQHPLWISPVDINTKLLKPMAFTRLKDYRSCGARVLNPEALDG